MMTQRGHKLKLIEGSPTFLIGAQSNNRHNKVARDVKKLLNKHIANQPLELQISILKEKFFEALTAEGIPGDAAQRIVLEYQLQSKIPDALDRGLIVSQVKLIYNALSISSVDAKAAALSADKPIRLGTPKEKYLASRGRNGSSENIIEFLKRVWISWIEAGALTRPVLRQNDPKAYQALLDFLKRHELPSGWSIPSRSELVERDLAAWQSGALSPRDAHEANRLARAAERRR